MSWRVSDCEELVGVTHRRLWGWFYKVSFLKELGKQGLRERELKKMIVDRGTDQW